MTRWIERIAALRRKYFGRTKHSMEVTLPPIEQEVQRIEAVIGLYNEEEEIYWPKFCGKACDMLSIEDDLGGRKMVKEIGHIKNQTEKVNIAKRIQNLRPDGWYK